MCYALSVDWSTRMQEGLALAAAAHGDRGAMRATPGLAPSVSEPATRVARALAADEANARRTWIRGLLETRPSPRADLSAAPPRALALLAPSAPRALGRAWLAAAPLPRPGYVPDRGLLTVLHALAAREPGSTC
jgi:hypothetical protein